MEECKVVHCRYLLNVDVSALTEYFLVVSYVGNFGCCWQRTLTLLIEDGLSHLCVAVNVSRVVSVRTVLKRTTWPDGT